MFYPIILIACVAFAYLAWRNIEKAALVLVAILPLYVVRFSIVLPTTLLEVCLLILFAVWFIKNWSYYGPRFKEIFSGKFKPQHRYPFDLELILWIAIAFAAVGFAGFGISSFGIWRAYFFEPALAFILFVNIFNSKEKIIKVLGALGISALVISLFAIYQYLTGQFIPNEFWAKLGQRRSTSIFPFPNAVGLYLAPIIFLLVGLAATVYKRSKRFFAFIIVAIIAALIAILFARSEGAIFAVAITGLIALFGATKKTRLIAVMIIAVGALSLSLYPTLDSYVRDRVLLKNFSGEIRRLQWKETMTMLKDGRLLSGAGLNNYQASVKPYHQEGFFINTTDPDFLRRVNTDKEYAKAHWQPLEIYLYPHNIALNFWTELGLLGLLLFVWIIIRYFYAGVGVYRKLQADKEPFAWIVFGLMLAMIAIIIHGMVDVPYFKNDLAILFWLMMALMGVSSLSSKKAELV